jgi:hypothetical protein
METNNCGNEKCKAYSRDCEFNCSINGFTSAIGCQQYFPEGEITGGRGMKDCRDCRYFTTTHYGWYYPMTYYPHYCEYYDKRIKNFPQAETCQEYKEK